MYSGSLIQDLVEMVARAESHAQQQFNVAAEAEPEPMVMFMPRYGYERSNQQAYVGVA
jgi:hypothetical protein